MNHGTLLPNSAEVGRYGTDTLVTGHSIHGKTIPEECSVEIKNYFAAAFDKASLGIVLDQEQGETIVFPLKAMPPKKTDRGNWSVSFKISGPPFIFASRAYESFLSPKDAKPETKPAPSQH